MRQCLVALGNGEQKGEKMARYIEVNALMNYANNQKDKTIDANDIARFPCADVVERKRGKWIYDDFGYHCSECWTRYPNEITDELNYCPNCGAQMDERREDGEKCTTTATTQTSMAYVIPTTADVVEVVHCKDCSWCQLKSIRRGKFDALFECILWENPTTGDFYCAAGERRE